MRRLRGTVVVAAALALVVPGSAEAGETTIWLSDNEFTQSSVTLTAPGASFGTVTWEAHPTQPPSNEHNVREDHRLFFSGPPTSWATKEFTRVFSSGTYDYKCQVHGPEMSGIVRVEMTQGFDTIFPILVWAEDTTNTGQVFDVQFKVDQGRWRKWKTDTEKFKGVFGRNDRPVPYNPSREYRFRARSQKRDNMPAARSRWSPVELLA
jgi:plastocyanin